jgi:hypothetical protein
MAFISVLIAAAIILAVGGSTLAASKRVRGYPRLPMQWGFDGKPTWFASRRLALAFGPIVFSGVTILILVSTQASPTPLREPTYAEYLGIWFIQAIAGVVCLGCQALYLALLTRWAARSSG